MFEAEAVSSSFPHFDPQRQVCVWVYHLLVCVWVYHLLFRREDHSGVGSVHGTSVSQLKGAKQLGCGRHPALVRVPCWY